MKSRIINHIVISVFLSTAIACIVLLLFYPDNSPLGSYFSIFVVLIIARFMALIAASTAILLRILRVFTDNLSLLYILTGTINVLLATAGVFLFFIEKADIDWLHTCLLNLLAGFIIFVDRFIFPTTPPRQSDLF